MAALLGAAGRMIPMWVPGGSRPEVADQTIKQVKIRIVVTGPTSSIEVLADLPIQKGSRGIVILATDSGEELSFELSVVSPAGDLSQARQYEAVAERATLDAAAWLMPDLPRELVAEALGLGKYRRKSAR
ncbi:hypothetical protein ACEZDB_32550 [Streptacidiphilus sp. N1-3]|uniref:Polyketide cyclase / dehydrase and lipid transport n=1 Tax=Streptacidiphilus alkalitolerans TaxID=3342712 RepID=A0ABV6XBK4_9ACTN